MSKDVELLLKDPEKSILRLSIPVMIGMFIQTLYNLVDGIWVAGLGPNALAAVGLFSPIFLIIISLATGIGIGVNSVVSMKIGQGKKSEAELAGFQAILISIILSIISMIIAIPSLNSLLLTFKTSSETLNLSYRYGIILLWFIPLIMFNNTASGILRGEGNTKKPTIALVIGALLNMVLDPIFIYTFKLGVEGAAWATVISTAISTLVLVYILFISKKNYLKISLNGKFHPELFKKILYIGLPSSLAQVSMSIAIFFLNNLASVASKDIGIAVFTAVWRLINLGTLPVIGISAAVTTVSGAMYGAKKISRIESSLDYAFKIGLTFTFSALVLFMMFGDKLAFLFAYSKGSRDLLPEISHGIRFLSLFLLGTPFGMLTQGLFQGIGHSVKGLVMTILRTIVFQLMFGSLFIYKFNMGLNGLWLGIILGNATATLISYHWGQSLINGLKAKYESSTSNPETEGVVGNFK